MADTKEHAPQALEYMTITETAKALELTRAVVYDFLNSGALRASRLGGRTIVFPKDFSKFVSELPPYQAAGPGSRAGRKYKGQMGQ